MSGARHGFSGLALLVTAFLQTGVPAWAAERGQLARLVVITDRSSSIERGDGAACIAVRRVVTDALTEEGLFGKGAGLANLGHSLDRDEATVVEVWGTADTTRAGVARKAGEHRLVMRTVMEDYDALLAQRRRKAREIGEGVEKQCRAMAQPQNVSPVYSALSQVVSAMKNNCSAAAECLLVIQSDLIETTEPGVTSAVQSIIKGIPPRARVLPAPLDLEGRLSILVCGYGVSTETVSEDRRHKIVQFWRDSLLLKPKRWVAQPQCPGYEPQRGR